MILNWYDPSIIGSETSNLCALAHMGMSPLTADYVRNRTDAFLAADENSRHEGPRRQT